MAEEDTRTATSVDGPAPPSAPAPGSAPAPSEPPETVGRFRLEARLGSGGMAHVYRAYDPMLDRAVALKILRVSESPSDDEVSQGMRRVLREARAAASLTHPNTVTIFEVGEADGQVFIAMELLAGETLRARMRRGDADFALKMRWLVEAATALSAAHERGLVHRDIKPDNMFVCTPGDTLKLLDFGIAKRQEEPAVPAGDDVTREAQPDSIGPSSLRTEMGVRVGTPRYMAPEQRAGQATDARTDQYAWGLVAFELLTGTHAIAAPDTVTRGRPADAPTISEPGFITPLTAAHVTPKLAAVVARALEPRQEDRYPSMAALLAAIHEEKPAPKRRWPLVAAGVLGMVAIGVTVQMRMRPHVEPVKVDAAPACHIGTIREFPMNEDDRIAALPNGDIAIARDIKKGLNITRESGSVLTTHAGALAILGVFKDSAQYEDVRLSGIRLMNEPWLLVNVNQGIERGSLAVGISENSFFAQRLQPPISGLAAQSLGKDHVVFGVTTFGSDQRYAGIPSGAEVYIQDANSASRPISVEAGEAQSPAVATSPDETRIAFAYGLQQTEPKRQQKLQLAILNDKGDRVSDIMTILTAPTVIPAVAFAGPAMAIVLWVEDLGGATRLRSSTFTPGDARPTAGTIAVDEPALSFAPMTARLPGGDWAAMWIASQKNVATLRIAPIGSRGALGAPASVGALSTQFDQLAASPSDHGIYLTWRDVAPNGARIAKIAEATCP